MPAIYPSTALKNKQLEIKAIADHEPVYITENGRGKYVFVSEEALQRHIDAAVEDALYEMRVTQALEESRRDYEEGRSYTTREALMDAVAQKRRQHAQA